MRSQHSADTLPLGHGHRPLKGILKNNLCSSTLPRQHQDCSCSYLGETLPDQSDHQFSFHFPCPAEPQDSVYYSSANISCEAGDKLSEDEVLDTVESSV